MCAILINVVAPNRMGMISRYSAVTLPISVGILAGYLLSKNKEVKVVDELIAPFDKSLSDIKDYLRKMEKPYIFGISCLTINMDRAIRIAKYIKDCYLDSKVIFGGIHPTVLPEESLGTQAVDIVIRGEGEETLFLLCDAIENYKSYFDIAGISFREGPNIKHNLDRPLVDELDNISFFPYELFDNSKYNLGFTITSRGCPYSCIFCSQRYVSGRRYRVRSNENVIEEIGLLVNKYHQENISFLDDDFLFSKERVKTLCKLIVQNKFHIKTSFACQTRAKHIDMEILSYLKEAGFTDIGIGFETGSEKLMHLINKSETVKDNIESVRLLHKMGFNSSAFFIFGLPSETSKERLKTYLLSKDLKIKYAKFNNLVPYPGTKLFEIAREEGTLNIEENWKNFNSVGGVVEGLFTKFKMPFIPKENTEIGLRKDLVRANLYFYMSRLSFVLSLLRRENPGWFTIKKSWYLKPKECFYIIKLGIQVLLNCIVVFDLRWFISEVLWNLKSKERRL